MLQASRRRQTPVTDVPGIGEKTAEKLAEAGIATLGDLLDKSAAELAEIPGSARRPPRRSSRPRAPPTRARSAESRKDEEEDEEAEVRGRRKKRRVTE